MILALMPMPSAKQSKSQDKELENIRHSFAHLLNIALRRLYPGAQPAIGPAIENGFYQDFGNVEISEKDLPKIEKEIRAIAKQNLLFKKELWSVKKAVTFYQKEKQPFKVAIAKDLVKEQKLAKLGIVKTGNLLVDLCRGGHIKNTSELPLDAFKLTKVAGAYWRGEEKNPMLTRVYGVAFATKKELTEHLKLMEEAEKRDHRKLGRELGLFIFSELVGPGLPLFTPKGMTILQQIKDYSRQLRKEIGYQEVQTPQINKADLFRASGHYDKFKDDMFHVRSNYTKEEYFMKPMNCPQHTQLFASEFRSYKDMPVRYADFSMLYRDEKPGELNGLSRLRAFSQDDGHSFCREDQITDEFNRILGIVEKTMKTYHMDYSIRLSLRDEKQKDKYLGDDTTWRKSQKILKKTA